MPHLRSLIAASFVVAVLAVPRAHANGRLPNTTYPVFHPTDPNRMVLGATYGLLFSTDGGCSFHWVCEQAVTASGFGGADPSVYWAANGVITVVSYGAVSISTDDGCTWHDDATFTSDPNVSLVEVAPHAGRPQTWYIVALDYVVHDSVIHRTQDGGSTFTPLPLNDPNIYWQTLRASPALPTRVYASGANSTTFIGPMIATSNDGGETWSHTRMAVTVPNVTTLFIGAQQTIAMHPTDPNTFLLSVLDSSNNAIYVILSRDGGATGTVVQAVNSGYRGAAFAPDGQTAWFSTTNALYRSSDGGQSFTQLPAPIGNSCLGVRDGILYGCGATGSEHYIFALSQDAGDSWKPLLLGSDLLGPCRCAAGTSVQATCPAQWPLVAGPLGASQDPSAAPSPHDAACGIVAATGGSSGATGDAGATGGGGGTKTGGGGRSGCTAAAGSPIATLAVAWAHWRRRHARGRRVR